MWATTCASCGAPSLSSRVYPQGTSAPSHVAPTQGRIFSDNQLIVIAPDDDTTCGIPRCGFTRRDHSGSARVLRIACATYRSPPSRDRVMTWQAGRFPEVTYYVAPPSAYGSGILRIQETWSIRSGSEPCRLLDPPIAGHSAHPLEIRTFKSRQSASYRQPIPIAKRCSRRRLPPRAHSRRTQVNRWHGDDSPH